jgi:hypothetical protein
MDGLVSFGQCNLKFFHVAILGVVIASAYLAFNTTEKWNNEPASNELVAVMLEEFIGNAPLLDRCITESQGSVQSDFLIGKESLTQIIQGPANGRPVLNGDIKTSKSLFSSCHDFLSPSGFEKSRGLARLKSAESQSELIKAVLLKKQAELAPTAGPDVMNASGAAGAPGG